ncbi:MAG: hypothetical protein M1379_09160 [Firmicutes bacterium]|nr:hypothetical protein [Bacillota bacterium]
MKTTKVKSGYIILTAILLIMLPLLYVTRFMANETDISRPLQNGQTKNATEDTGEPNVIPLEVSMTVERFIKSIKDNDYSTFEELVSPAGLTIIRNFLTGYGARGKNIRHNYSKAEIPQNLQFPVEGEIPVDLKQLFNGTMESDAKNIPGKLLRDIQFGFKNNENSYPEPPTPTIREVCGKIRSSERENDSGPRIFILGEKEFALTESMIYEGLAVGTWAVFEKTDDRHLLRAIIDFRY